MKTKRIYLLRHGETDFNKNGMVQGRGINASLNATGQLQAEKAYRKLNEIAFDKFYSSSLARTHETLAPFQSDFIQKEGFDEISWGNQEGMKTSPETENMYAGTLNNWRNGKLDLNVGGGESPIEVMDRQKRALESVLKDADESILICMHGRAMRIMLCWMLNYPLNYMDGFPHQNCAFYSLNYTGYSFFLNEFNEKEHLRG